VKCWVGCSPAAVKAEITKILADSGKLRPFRPQPHPASTFSSSEFIARTWRQGEDPHGTPTEVYLNNRGWFGRIPNSIRHHSGLWHKESCSSGSAMIGLVRSVNGTVTALHRTWLASDGTGKASLSPVRKSLGPTLGSSIWLGVLGETVLVAEGIETALAAMTLFRRPGLAAVSAPGLVAVQIPHGVQDVLIAGDNDEVGLKAANSLAARLRRDGLEVQIVVPPVPDTDFNDVLLGRAA
jgi:hypothetical protein